MITTKNFNSQDWTDRGKARSIIDSALSEATGNPTSERMRSYCQQLWKLYLELQVVEGKMTFLEVDLKWS